MMGIVCLAGDGIGPEVMASAVETIRALAPELELQHELIGEAAIQAAGDPLPQQTLDACLRSDAVLFGAAGTSGSFGVLRAEEGLIRLRRELDVYANLRPTRTSAMDLLIVRELVGGLYYGDKGRTTNDAFDTCVYSRHQIERVARRGFDLARDRGQRLTSVDKANVLETSRLWREVVTDIGASYPDVELDHVLVDAAGLFLVQDPGRFGVIVTENTFGDILSDVAAGLGGGLGLAASASLSDGGPGVFEPVHGSAPDIAGLGIANPVAMLRSVVLMFTYGLARPDLAEILDSAIERAIELAPTPDLGGCATTSDVTAAVLSAIAS